MMKKIFWPVLTLFVSVLCLSLTSCSKDDDDDAIEEVDFNKEGMTMGLPNGKTMHLKYVFAVTYGHGDYSLYFSDVKDFFAETEPENAPEYYSFIRLDLEDEGLHEGTISSDIYYIDGYYNRNTKNHNKFDYAFEMNEDESSDLVIKKSGNIYEITVSHLREEYETDNDEDGEYTTWFHFKGEIPPTIEIRE